MQHEDKNDAWPGKVCARGCAASLPKESVELTNYILEQWPHVLHVQVLCTSMPSFTNSKALASLATSVKKNQYTETRQQSRRNAAISIKPFPDSNFRNLLHIALRNMCGCVGQKVSDHVAANCGRHASRNSGLHIRTCFAEGSWKSNASQITLARAIDIK